MQDRHERQRLRYGEPSPMIPPPAGWGGKVEPSNSEQGREEGESGLDHFDAFYQEDFGSSEPNEPHGLYNPNYLNVFPSTAHSNGAVPILQMSDSFQYPMVHHSDFGHNPPTSVSHTAATTIPTSYAGAVTMTSPVEQQRVVCGEHSSWSDNSFGDGYTLIRLKTRLHDKYWRNERRLLCCFPDCAKFGNYAASRNSKKVDANCKKGSFHTPCSRPLLAEIKIVNFGYPGFNTTAIPPSNLETVIQSRDLVVFATIHEVGKAWRRDTDTDSNTGNSRASGLSRDSFNGGSGAQSVSSSDSDYCNSGLMYNAGQIICQSELPKESDKNVFEGEVTVVDSTSASITIRPRNWIYNSLLSRKRRRADAQTSDLHVVEVTAFVSVGSGMHHVLHSVMSEPFQVESTKTLGRRLSALTQQRAKFSPLLSIGLFHLLNTADFQVTGTVPVVFEGGSDSGANVPESSGVYSWISDTCESVLGYTPEELVGIDTWKLVEPSDALFLQKGVKAEDGTKFKMHVRFRRIRKDGSLNWTKLYVVKSVKFPESITLEHEFEHYDQYAEFVKEAGENKEHVKEALQTLNETMFLLAKALSFLNLNDPCQNELSRQLSLIYCNGCVKMLEIDALRTNHTYNVQLHSSQHATFRSILRHGVPDHTSSISPVSTPPPNTQESFHTTQATGKKGTEHQTIETPSITPLETFTKFRNNKHVIRGHEDLIVLADMTDELLFMQLNSAGFILWMSNSVENLLGYKKHELLFGSHWSLVHPDDVSLLAREQTIRQSSRAFFRRRTKGGEYIVVEAVTISMGDFVVTVERRAGTNHKEILRRKSLAQNLAVSLRNDILQVSLPSIHCGAPHSPHVRNSSCEYTSNVLGTLVEKLKIQKVTVSEPKQEIDKLESALKAIAIQHKVP